MVLQKHRLKYRKNVSNASGVLFFPEGAGIRVPFIDHFINQ